MPEDRASENDVILLAKKWITSSCLPQHPLLLLPQERCSLLVTSVPDAILRPNALSKRALRQYQKTANVISEQPWNMKDAAKYLREWCFRNERNMSFRPAELCFYTSECLKSDRLHASKHLTGAGKHEVGEGLAWTDFAPGTPKRVVVQSVAPKFVPVPPPRIVNEDAESEDLALADLPPVPIVKRPAAAVKSVPRRPHKRPAAAMDEPPAGCDAEASEAEAEPNPVRARPSASQAMLGRPPYGCSKCRFKRGCNTCKRFAPGCGP